MLSNAAGTFKWLLLREAHARSHLFSNRHVIFYCGDPICIESSCKCYLSIKCLWNTQAQWSTFNQRNWAYLVSSLWGLLFVKFCTCVCIYYQIIFGIYIQKVIHVFIARGERHLLRLLQNLDSSEICALKVPFVEYLMQLRTRYIAVRSLTLFISYCSLKMNKKLSREMGSNESTVPNHGELMNTLAFPWSFPNLPLIFAQTTTTAVAEAVDSVATLEHGSERVSGAIFLSCYSLRRWDS